MDLKQVEYILKIAEENNITHAAEKLFITQSALNQQLLKLEKELGTPLFYRSRTNWRPTPAGEVYIENARKMLLIKENTYNRIYDIAKEEKGKLSIAFTPGRGISMFSHVYPEFHALYPRIQIHPGELSVHEQQTLLLSGQLDIGFMTLLDCQKKAGLIYTSLVSEELVLAIPKKLAFLLHSDIYEDTIRDSAPQNIGFADTPGSFPTLDIRLLREEPFVLLHKSSTMRSLTDSIFRQAGFSPDILFETANNHTILSMIRAGICCGIIPMYYVNREDTEIAYFSLISHPTWEITAAYRKGYYMTKAAKEFVSLAASYYTDSE